MSIVNDGGIELLCAFVAVVGCSGGGGAGDGGGGGDVGVVGVTNSNLTINLLILL